MSSIAVADLDGVPESALAFDKILVQPTFK